MIKFRDFGAYKNAKNIGYCVASVEMHNGQVAEFDLTTKTAKFPTDATAAGLAVVMNSIEKPEILSPNEYVIEVGEYPRLFILESLKNEILDMDMDQVDGEYTDVEVGKFLIPKTDGKWEIADAAGSSAIALEVVELTSYNGEGIGAKVVIA